MMSFVKLILQILVLGLITPQLHMVESHVVEYLPGFRGKLPFTFETGYIGVGDGDGEEIETFYYFVQSQRNPETDPLLLWLTGGPGCSGLSSIFYENGPFMFDYANSTADNPTLLPNPNSLSMVANMIYIDQPGDTGFSYVKSQEAYECRDTSVGKTIYEFLKKWLINHSKYLDNPLYIGGYSYSGKFVPLALDQIYKGIEVGNKPHFNIKGYILGNPITDASTDFNGRIPYAYRMGLLSEELYLSAKEKCNENYVGVDEDNYLCKGALERVNQCLDKIFMFQILEPVCVESTQDISQRHVLSSSVSRRFLPSLHLSAKSWCRDMNMEYSEKWVNLKLVQEALHIREGTKTKWLRCNHTINESYVEDIKSVVDYHTNFTRKDVRALIMSGDHDMAVPHTATEKWIQSMKLNTKSFWRPWFFEGQVAGYITKYLENNHELTYITVRGAGHSPSEYKPRECFSMIEKWFNHNLL